MSWFVGMFISTPLVAFTTVFFGTLAQEAAKDAWAALRKRPRR